MGFIPTHGLRIILILSITLYMLSPVYSQEEKNENILPALELSGDYFSPFEGMSISKAKELVQCHLIGNNVQIAADSNLEISELTTKLVWENIGVQLYAVKPDYAWVDAVAIVRNNEVLSFLDCMPITTIFLADLDGDTYYEIYCNYFSGSGIISEEISGYNVITGDEFKLSKRFEDDLHLFVQDGILKAEVTPYRRAEHHDQKIINYLEIVSEGGSTKLSLKLE